MPSRSAPFASLLVAGLSLTVAAPALAAPAMTTAPSVMRREPTPAARVVQHIPANAQIDLQNCGGDWCYGSWRNRFGYIPAWAVSAAAPPPPAEFGGGGVLVGPPPIYGSGFGWGGPYIGGGWGWGRW